MSLLTWCDHASARYTTTEEHGSDIRGAKTTTQATLRQLQLGCGWYGAAPAQLQLGVKRARGGGRRYTTPATAAAANITTAAGAVAGAAAALYRNGRGRRIISAATTIQVEVGSRAICA